PAISPAAGAYIAEWIDWRAIFLLLAVLGAAVLALTTVFLGETNIRPTRLDVVGMAGAYLSLLRSPAVFGFAFCSACTSASWVTLCASAPYILLRVMHRPPSAYGLMILMPMASYMLGNFIAARFTVRFGSMAMFVSGVGLSFVSGIAMAGWCIAAASPWAL